MAYENFCYGKQYDIDGALDFSVSCFAQQGGNIPLFPSLKHHETQQCGGEFMLYWTSSCSGQCLPAI